MRKALRRRLPECGRAIRRRCRWQNKERMGWLQELLVEAHDRRAFHELWRLARATAGMGVGSGRRFFSAPRSDLCGWRAHSERLGADGGLGCVEGLLVESQRAVQPDATERLQAAWRDFEGPHWSVLVTVWRLILCTSQHSDPWRTTGLGEDMEAEAALERNRDIVHRRLVGVLGMVRAEPRPSREQQLGARH